MRFSISGTGKRPTVVPLDLAPNRGLPSQHLSMLLVRSYHTFAPLPVKELGKRQDEYIHPGAFYLYPSHRRYVSVALSSRSPALGVTQQVWSFGSPDFPQTRRKMRIRNHLRLLSLYSSLDLIRG